MFVILLDKAVRHNNDITQAIGPFLEMQEAMDYATKFDGDWDKQGAKAGMIEALTPPIGYTATAHTIQ